MTTGFAIQMLIILIFSGLLIYGFTKEEKIAEWEKQTLDKLFRYIYNKIVAYENWRDMKKVGVKPHQVTGALFEQTYHYYDGYKTLHNIIGNEDHELVTAMRNKWYACYKVILESGLDEMYMDFVEKKQKPY